MMHVVRSAPFTVALATATALALSTTVARAQEAPAAAARGLPPLIPVEHFFDNPEISGAQVSPDGRWLGYRKAWRGKLNVYVRPLRGDTAEERRLTSDSVRSIGGWFWAQDGSRVLWVQDRGGDENFHVYAVRPDDPGARPTDLTPMERGRAVIFDVPYHDPSRILVGLNTRDPSAFDAYWIDLATGRRTLAVENPGRFGSVLADRQLRVRLATAQGTDGATEIHARDAESSPWRLVARWPAEYGVSPLRFHPDGRRVYLRSNANADLARLELLDLATGATTPVEADPLRQVDLGAAAFSERTDSLLATVYDADTTRIYPRAAWMRTALADLRKLSRGAPSLGSTTRDENLWVVAFDNPVDPGVTYLYDRRTRKAEFLFRPRPWLKPEQLAPMQPVRYAARDGLVVHGYLTVPKGVSARRLPMVLLVHGGPWARDAYGYDPEAQFLANRGYAVLQVNYRGSTGYGRRFYNAAVKQFGRAMHDDLIDGVRWAVRSGVADSARVGIYGGSYGGYATLAGVTFTPRVFRAAVDYVGPSSLITLIQSFPPYWRPFLEGTWYRFVGDPVRDSLDLKSRSPLFHVDSIRTPLMVVQGANDPRVTKRESDQLVVALRDRGVKVRYLVATNEGHGFANADNRMALYRSMETFLAEHLGGRAAPSTRPEIEAQIARLTVDVDTLRAPAAGGASPSARVAVGVGDSTLATTWLAPGASTWQMVMARGGQEQPFGTAEETLTVDSLDGRPVLRRVQRTQSAMGVQADSAWFDRATLAPLRQRSAGLRTARLDWADGRVRGEATSAMGGAARPVDAALDRPAFDLAIVDLVIASLPLAEGYAARLPVYMTDAGGLVEATAEVVGSERVRVGGADVDAWKVATSTGGQRITLWVAKDSRQTVRMALDAGPGTELRFVRP